MIYTNIIRGFGVGVDISSPVASYAYVTNTSVIGNTISNFCSIGILTSDGHRGTTIAYNNFADNDIGIRYHHFGTGSDNFRTVYVYRNTSFEPPNAGTHIFVHSVNTSPSSNLPFYYTYNNSFAGGYAGISDNGNTPLQRGLSNCTFVANIWSDHIFYRSDDSGWTNINVVGTWDNNLITPPRHTYPTGAMPDWWCSNNKTNATAIWTSAYGMSFALPVGSVAIDNGLDVGSTFTACGHSNAALPVGSDVKIGSQWDIGALEFDSGTPPTPFTARAGRLKGVKLRP